MQPQEPAVGPVSQPPPQRGPVAGGIPAPPPAPAKQPNRRGRLILAIVAGVVGLLCLGGVGVFVSVYDEATKIDRAEPDQVVSSFLRSYLVNRSDQEASLYTCKSGAKLDALASLRSEMVEREKNFGTTVTATWESLTVSGPSENTKSVSVDLVIIGSANGQQVSSHSESWAFGLVDEDGWRVCDAARMS